MTKPTTTIIRFFKPTTPVPVSKSTDKMKKSLVTPAITGNDWDL
jgi:hypothetical protein